MVPGKNYAELVRQAVTRSHGATSMMLRREIMERAAATARDDRGPDLGSLNRVVDHIARHPSAAEVESLLAEGQSEDAVFEIVIAAAVGAGTERVKRALEVLDRFEP